MSEIQNSIPAGQQPSLADSSATGTTDSMWNRCRQLAIPRLTQGLAMALSYVMGDLSDQAKQARDMNHFRLLEQAKDSVRYSRDGIVSSFQRRFTEFTDPAGVSNALTGGPNSQLSLMSDPELHDTSSHDVVAQTIMTVCDLELRGMTRRFKELSGSGSHGGPINPLDPDLIGRTVLVALREREISVTLRRLLAPILAEHLAESTRILYQDILDLFAGKGIYASEKAQQHLVPQGGMGGTGAARTNETTLQSSGTMAAAAKPVPPARGRALSAALLALTRLQRGQIQLAMPYAPDTAEVLHRLADAKFITDLGSSALLVLNMVTALFEAVLNDRRIAASIKTQVARLQVPMLKVALLDPGFLKQQTHPVRQLLDTLADAARNTHLMSDRAAFEQALTTRADRIVAEFEEDQTLFAEAGHAIQQQLDKLKQSASQGKATQQASASADAPQPDKAEFRQQIRHEAKDGTLPKSVMAFLFEQWETLYRAVYTQPLQADPAMAEPSKVLSSLIRTLEPSNWQGDRAGMLGLLPGVLKRIKQGMQAAQMPQEAQDRFLASLAKCHAVVMQAAKELAAPAPVAMPADSQTAATTPPAPAVAPEKAAPAPSPSRSDRYEALVRTLQRGALIEFRDQGGSMSWLKLAWISPNGGIFVFTNKQGERALTINAAALAERFRQEQARVAIDSTVREGSPSQMIGGIQRVA